MPRPVGEIEKGPARGPTTNPREVDGVTRRSTPPHDRASNRTQPKCECVNKKNSPRHRPRGARRLSLKARFLFPARFARSRVEQTHTAGLHTTTNRPRHSSHPTSKTLRRSCGIFAEFSLNLKGQHRLRALQTNQHFALPLRQQVPHRGERHSARKLGRLLCGECSPRALSLSLSLSRATGPFFFLFSFSPSLSRNAKAQFSFFSLSFLSLSPFLSHGMEV